MRGNEELPAELKAIEAELSALTPQEARIDRARLLFAAGQASARRRAVVVARAWAAAFSAMTVVAASLLVALVVHPVGPRGTQPVLAESESGTPREATTVAGVRQGTDSDAPADAALADADNDNAPAHLLRYRMPERTSVLAALFFGVSNDLKRPIRPALADPLEEDWAMADDFDNAPQPATHRQSALPAPSEAKTYRELLKELTKNHG